MTRLLTDHHIEIIDDFIRREVQEQRSRGEDIDPMELRAHALNEFRSHYTHDGRGKWNDEIEADAGSYIDTALSQLQIKKEI